VNRKWKQGVLCFKMKGKQECKLQLQFTCIWVCIRVFFQMDVLFGLLLLNFAAAQCPHGHTWDRWLHNASPFDQTKSSNIGCFINYCEIACKNNSHVSFPSFVLSCTLKHGLSFPLLLLNNVSWLVYPVFNRRLCFFCLILHLAGGCFALCAGC
jgi:hypothetical protein